MDAPSPKALSQLSAQAAAKRAAERIYYIEWRSTGAQQVKGRAQAAATLGLSEKSLGVYLSNGRLARGIVRPHPVTGEDDVVTVTTQAKEPAEKRPRGRPRKERAEQP